MRLPFEDAIWAGTCYHTSVLLCICLAIVLSATPLAHSTQAYHVGLDFIDTTTTAPPAFLSDFDPFLLTSPSNFFVTQGGLVGWTEQQARRAVALAVDDAFREIDVGDPNRTVNIAIHFGPAPSDLVGQRLNLVLAQPAGLSLAILGQADRGVYNRSGVTDTIVAATFLDEIDGLGSSFLNYDTAEGVINSIAGVTAHEIGHVFDAGHVTTSAAEPDPLPLMATEITGLPTDARLRERRFSTTEPVGVPIADLIQQNAGTVVRGDFNLDQLVNGFDLGILVGNWGMSDRLYAEGDATGDHLVNQADFDLLVQNWSAHSTATISTLVIPEPSSEALVVCGLLSILFAYRLHIARPVKGG